MDEEERDWDFNFSDSAELIRQQAQQISPNQSKYIVDDPKSRKSQLKAINPYQASKNLPEKQREVYLKMLQHGKFHPGLFHIFQQQKQEQFPGVQQMNQCMIEDAQQQDYFFLNSLFEPKNHNQLLRIEQQSNQIKIKWSQISSKLFQSFNPHKCITQNFYSRFDNFAYLHGQQNFIKDLEISLINFINEAKKLEGPSMQLILSIYQFWNKMFKGLIQQIFKYSQKYTLDFVKKNKGNESSNHDGYSSSNFQAKSGNSSRFNDLDKRRPWKQSQIDILQKLIQTQTIFSTALINRIAQQLNRSPASVSSKIQKINKNRNIQNPDFTIDDNTTLFDRIFAVLKNYQQGLSRQNIIDRINEHYQMGLDDSWNKSVAQILSSRPEFVKIKGVYGLIGEHNFDINKKFFKDKVVNCLLRCPNRVADLKKLVDVYIQLYGNTEGAIIFSEKRKKQIQASFSKALSRYPIFDKTKSKTVYKLREFCQPQDFDIEIQSYIS